MTYSYIVNLEETLRLSDDIILYVCEISKKLNRFCNGNIELYRYGNSCEVFIRTPGRTDGKIEIDLLDENLNLYHIKKISLNNEAFHKGVDSVVEEFEGRIMRFPKKGDDA